MKRFFFIALALFCICISADAAKPTKKKKPAKTTATSQDIRSQKKKNEKSIKETDAQIKENDRKVKNKLNQLNLLNGQISRCNDSISTLSLAIDSLTAESKMLTDSIARLEQSLTDLRSAFGISLRNARRARANTSKVALVFASDNFTQAFRRLRAMDQFDLWRSRKVAEIHKANDTLNLRKLQLDSLAIQLREAHSAIASRKSSLVIRQKDADKVVTELRGRDKELRRILKQQQETARRLDNELNRIIAEEQRRAREEEERRAREEDARRKAAETKGGKPVSDSNKPPVTRQPERPETFTVGKTFAQSRGALPSPVEGGYTVVKRFGRQRHPLYNNIEIDNAGIDLETAREATVRAVYDGKVSAVFCPDQITQVIVIRHGDYVTVYANLGSISVAKGDVVKRGQAIGKVYSDPSDNNRSVLHFEIRNGANPSNVKKENPSLWLR